MKNYLLLSILILCLTSVVKGQISTHEVRIMQDKIRSVYDANILDESNTNFEVYLDEWKKGIVYAKSLSQPTIAPLRYFVYNKEFHLINNQNDTVVLNKSALIDSIIIEDKKFIYRSFENGNKEQNDYFQELSYGDLKLLKHYTCFFEKGNKSTATGYEKVVPDTYKIQQKLFYQKGHDSVQLLPSKMKDLLLLLNESKLEIFVKKNKLKLRKEEDLILLFNYYNSL